MSTSRYFCLWQQVDGVVGGAVVDADTLAVQHTFSFGSAAAPNSRPLILPAADGAVAVSIEGTGAAASIVARTVSPDGSVSEPWTLASPVLSYTTTLAAGSFFPGMYLLAWSDHLGDPAGLRVRAFSPSCPGGFVEGGSACTGLGDGRLGGVLP